MCPSIKPPHFCYLCGFHVVDYIIVSETEHDQDTFYCNKCFANRVLEMLAQQKYPPQCLCEELCKQILAARIVKD